MVTTSSTEAELYALSTTAKESMAFGRLLKNISEVFSFPLTIFCNNIQTIRLVTNASERINTKLKYVNIQNL